MTAAVPSPDVDGSRGAYFSAAASEALSLRRAARLVHCLQKERGASCALCAFASRPSAAVPPAPPLTHPLTGEADAGGSKPPTAPSLGVGTGLGGGAHRPLPLSPRRSSPPRSQGGGGGGGAGPYRPPPSSSVVSFSENDDAAHDMLSESLRCARRNSDAAIDLLSSSSGGVGAGRGRPDLDLPVRESLRKIRQLVDATASGHSGFEQGRSSASSSSPSGGAGAAASSAAAASALAAAEHAAAAVLSSRKIGGHSAPTPSPLRPPPSPLRSPERSAEAVGFHRILVAFNALVASVTHVCIVQRCDALKRRARGEAASGSAGKSPGKNSKRRHRKTDAQSPKAEGGVGIGGLLAAYDAATDSLCGPGYEATVESKGTLDSLESENTVNTNSAYLHRASSSLPIDLADGSPPASSVSPPSDAPPSQYRGRKLPPPLPPSSVTSPDGGGPGLPRRKRLPTADGIAAAGPPKAPQHRKAGSDFAFDTATKKASQPAMQRTRTSGGDGGPGGDHAPRPSKRETTASNRASSLISLLLSFVRLKESTGVERAVLSSLMVMGGGGGAHAKSPKRRRRIGRDKDRKPHSFGEADSPTRGGGGGNDGDHDGDDEGDGPDPFVRSRSSISEGGVVVGGVVPSMLLFSDLVLEEENRRRIVRELRRRAWDATTHGSSTHLHENLWVQGLMGAAGGDRNGGGNAQQGNGSFRILKGGASGGGGSKGRRPYDENYKSLLALVDQAVRPSPEMEHLHNTIRVDFDLGAFQHAMSLEEFWVLITVYIDRLHSLELLIVEELECCLATAAMAVAAANAAAASATAANVGLAIASSQNVAGATATAAAVQTTKTKRRMSELTTATFEGHDEDSTEEKKSAEGKTVGTEEFVPVKSHDGATTDVSALLQALTLGDGAAATQQSKSEAARALASVPPEQLKASLLAFLNSTQRGDSAADVPNESRNPSQNGATHTRDGDGDDDDDADGTCVSPLLPTVGADLPPLDAAAKEWEIDPYELEFRKRIGRGVAGTTYLAHWSGQKVAVKVAAITDMGLEGWNTEVRQLQRLHHPNIIRFLGSIYNPSPRTYGLVLEYCDAGDLSAALSRWTPPGFFFRVAGDVANGMAYLHGRRLLHRDIKPANILLHGDVATGTFTAKLTDFGVATITDGHSDDNAEHTAETGTYRWMAPEVIRHESYSFKADVFSFALVAWQLITREEPFRKLSQIEAAGLVALESARPPFPPDVSPSVVTFIERCWSENPDDRQSFDEIKNELRGLKKALTEGEREWLETPFGHPVYEVPVPVRGAPPAAAAPGIARGNPRRPPHKSKSWQEGEKQHSESEASESEDDHHGQKKKSSGWGFLGKKKKRASFRT